MNIQKKIKLLDKKIQALDIVIKNQQEKMEYLYEREKQRENFEKADRKFFNTYLIEATAQIVFFLFMVLLGYMEHTYVQELKSTQRAAD